MLARSAQSRLPIPMPLAKIFPVGAEVEFSAKAAKKAIPVGVVASWFTPPTEQMNPFAKIR